MWSRENGRNFFSQIVFITGRLIQPSYLPTLTHTHSLSQKHMHELWKFVRMNGHASTEKQSVSLILRILSSKKLRDLGIRTATPTDAHISLNNALHWCWPSDASLCACLCKHIFLKLNQTNRPRFANTFLLGMLWCAAYVGSISSALSLLTAFTVSAKQRNDYIIDDNIL